MNEVIRQRWRVATRYGTRSGVTSRLVVEILDTVRVTASCRHELGLGHLLDGVLGTGDEFGEVSRRPSAVTPVAIATACDTTRRSRGLADRSRRGRPRRGRSVDLPRRDTVQVGQRHHRGQSWSTRRDVRPARRRTTPAKLPIRNPRVPAGVDSVRARDPLR